MNWHEFTQEVIAEMRDDGLPTDELYEIEHHFSAQTFEALEKAAIAAFKKGYEVSEAEEIELEDGSFIYGFDVYLEQTLEEARLIKDVDTMLELAKETQIDYDGWGVTLEEEDDEDEA